MPGSATQGLHQLQVSAYFVFQNEEVATSLSVLLLKDIHYGVALIQYENATQVGK